LGHLDKRELNLAAEHTGQSLSSAHLNAHRITMLLRDLLIGRAAQPLDLLSVEVDFG
jgi:hypothetical protein